MNLDQVMTLLEQSGTEQTRRTWARHGMPEPYFGVLYGVINPLAKKLRGDHALARGLWKTGNGDARSLALMIADPNAATKAELEAWAREVGCYAHSDGLGKLAAQTRHAQGLLEKWTAADSQWIERAGWVLLASLVGSGELPDGFFEPWLKQIASRIQKSKNFVKDGMNSALISIGGRSEPLRRKAEAIAAKIGRVEVDWGDTNCSTPEAAAYIAKLWAYKEGRSKGTPMRVPPVKRAKKP